MEKLRLLISRLSPACICLQETLGDGIPSSRPRYRSFFYYLSFLVSLSLVSPPSVPIIRPHLDVLVHDLSPPFLILGDFNGRHPLWDDGATNHREVFLASFMKYEGLELLISGDVTHFHSQTGTLTFIDLSLCSPNPFVF